MWVKHTFVNCWHINDMQSDAMWKLYLHSNEGVAIRSTVGSLKESLIEKEPDIFIGKIKYIRYSKDVIPEGTLSPYFHKRKAFEHENELRAVIQKVKLDSKGNPAFGIATNKSGLTIPIDIDKLIKRIVISPKCLQWQRELVISILDKYGINKPVYHSTLYQTDDMIY
jgi:hypothetical protein